MFLSVVDEVIPMFTDAKVPSLKYLIGSQHVNCIGRLILATKSKDPNKIMNATNDVIKTGVSVTAQLNNSGVIKIDNRAMNAIVQTTNFATGTAEERKEIIQDLGRKAIDKGKGDVFDPTDYTLYMRSIEKEKEVIK